MYVKVITVFVISLASITLQVVGQLLNDEDSGTSQTSSLNIQKRDVKNEPLFLTPYTKNRMHEEARQHSRVTSDIFLGVQSHSGYLTVNETYDSNLFFWYFPGLSDHSAYSKPCIIWLSGGPGTSSLFAVFHEMGPFKVNYTTMDLEKNNETWVNLHSMVFIDNPVGTGFSFTNDTKGYARDMETYALHLKIAVTQLIEIFPELSLAPLYIGGESYGGKYAPALAMELHKAKKHEHLHCNLKGIITGNGFVDASVIADVPYAFHHASLITEEDLQKILPLRDAYKEDIKANKGEEAADRMAKLINKLYAFSGTNPYNLNDFSINFEHEYYKYALFLQNPEVKAALHVGDAPFLNDGNNNTVQEMLKGEFVTSARPLYEELLNNNYRVLAYCGMADMMLPCYLESEEYRKWKWNRAHEFLNATRNLYYIEAEERVGYHKTGGGLTVVQFRAAGHYVPYDLPWPLYELVYHFTHNGGVPEYYLMPINYVINTEELDEV